MAERKNVTVNFYKLESAVDTFYLDLGIKLDALAEQENPFGFFDGKSSELMFRVYDAIRTESRTLHLVSIVKEKVFLPVRFNREGEIQEAVESPDSLGDVSYGLIDTNCKCVLILGGRAANFCDFARWLSGDSAAGTSPLFRRDAIQTVLSWGIVKKILFSLKTEDTSMWADAMNRITDSEGLEGMQKSIYMRPYLKCGDIVDSMGGSSLEVTVSNKKNLDKEFVRGFIIHMGADGLFNSLKVSGKSFEEQKTEEIDLLAARVRHKAEIVIAGTHISPDEAKAALYEAYQLHLDDIEAANEEEGGNEQRD